MALYTQFQDPGAMIQEQGQRRDEKLRNLMSMMLQQKQYETEMAHQLFRDERALRAEEIAQQRANAYDKAVMGSAKREQTQWQARKAIAMMRWPNDPDKQQRYMLGEPADDIDWTWDRSYGEEELRDMADFSGSNPENLKTYDRKGLDNLARRYSESQYRFGTDVVTQRLVADKDAKAVEAGVNEIEDFLKYLDAQEKTRNSGWGGGPLSDAEAKQSKEARDALMQHMEIIQRMRDHFADNPLAPLTEAERLLISKARGTARAYRLGSYWWVSEEEKKKFLDRVPVDKNPVEKPKPMASITVKQAYELAAAAGLNPQEVPIKPQPDGTNTMTIKGKTYRVG